MLNIKFNIFQILFNSENVINLFYKQKFEFIKS